MKFLENILSAYQPYANILKVMSSSNNTISIFGIADIHKAHFVHSAVHHQKRFALFIVPTENIAQTLKKNLSAMGCKTVLYPSRELNFYNIDSQSITIEHQRLTALQKILNNEVNIVIASIDAIFQYTTPVKNFSANTFKLKLNEVISLQDVAKKLLNCGYERFDQVEGPGQFSIRGGILDLFIINHAYPVRIELFGDTIDSISFFDPATQRRTKSVEAVTIAPSREIIIENKEAIVQKLQNLKSNLSKNHTNANTLGILTKEIEILENTGTIGSRDKYVNLIYDNPGTIFDYLPKDSLIFLSEQAQINQQIKNLEAQWQNDLTFYLEEGILFKELGSFFLDQTAFLSQLTNKSTIYLDQFLTQDYFTKTTQKFSVNAREIPLWNGNISQLAEDLSSTYKDQTVVILAGNEDSANRIAFDLNQLSQNILFEESLNNITPGKTHVTTGALSEGFEYPDIKFSLISCNLPDKTTNKIPKKKNKKKSIYSISDLNIGDYIVHNLHGIGIFQGIHKLETQGIQKDYLKISYAKGDTLYVPVTQLDLIDKYIGPGAETRVKLNKLGSTDWQKSKARVKKATQDMAKELIKLYSERMKAQGHAFSEDNELQRDFEAQFEFEETPDQMQCIDEIKADMQKVAPMDRLLCGDVGFGKTEVALRAAFKCVCDSKQCAILVPTTILAWQHFQTVLKRFKSFPIRIELLSRFRTTKQQEAILKRLKRGEIDIIIGTHRLVQKDVQFYDLGLVIIDEEQRFGVKQKERFKELAKNVDILTLSATPIPRTLNMALSGIRDMSSLEEAPQNRVPVQTYVLEHDQAIINEAIRRELRRGGQIYYMHNSTGTISQKAALLQSQIPEAHVGYAHGKMSEQELSNVWQKVIDHEIDILVCTTIIETGIDIANVNTLIIENADNLGLSQLHQIRGRVGRSASRAFAYFTYKRNKALSEISQKRLSAIKEFTEFGSGFKIAMRDLELRGAGNILGGEQHGHLADVGYEMYIKLLGNAINQEKGTPVENLDLDCLVDIQVNAHIPESYISNVNQRLDIYRKISDIREKEDTLDVIDELIDRFGEPPKSVINLIDIALIRNTAANLGIYEIRQQNSIFLLFANELNQQLLEKFIKTMGSRITIKTAPKSHICVKINPALSPINNLKEILSLS